MGKRYSRTDYNNGRFYQLGKTLFNGIYKTLSNNERVIYSVLKDRFELSIQNGWVDKEDNIYFYFEQDSLAKECCVSLKTIQRCLQNLIEIGLIDSVRQGQNQPNRLYLLKPDGEDEKEAEKPPKTDKQRTGHFDASEQFGQVKMTHPDESKSPTNETKKNETDNISSSSTVDNRLCETILEKTKVSEDDLSDRLCDSVRKILVDICTVDREKQYRVDGKSVEVTAELQEQIAGVLNAQAFIGLIRAIQDNPEPINNLKAFVFACMFNFWKGNMRLGTKSDKCKQQGNNAFNNFEQRKYDFTELEKNLLRL